MQFIDNRQDSRKFGSIGFLGLALTALVGCGQGETTTTSGDVTPSGSAALNGPIAFVRNTGDKSLTSIAIKGDSGNAVINTIPAVEFENGALGDAQFSVGEWLFVNLGSANKVATIDPLTNATPVHEVNLTTGTRPVHIYRDPTNGEIMWSMNDGDNISGSPTSGDDLINCAVPTGGSVTILHNSHLGPGAVPPTVMKTVCLLARGHHVTAFSSGAGIPKRAFVSTSTAGEIAVIGNDPFTADYHTLIDRIDLCDQGRENAWAASFDPPKVPITCNSESGVSTTPFTPNNSNPHGIRFSNLTKRVYSIQQGYGEIAEIDPDTFAITNRFDLNGTGYTNYGISPDGRFLLLRGDLTPGPGTKLGVIDLGTLGNPRTDFVIPELDGASPGSFKFSPDGKRFYILAGTSGSKKDRLFAFDASTLTAATPSLTLLREIFLVGSGEHSFDILVLGAGEAAYLAVSNGIADSVSIISAADNTIKHEVHLHDNAKPGGVLIYYPGAAAKGNQASS